MPTLDVFKADAFNVMSLTAAFNKVPFQPARLGQLGLFTPKFLTTTVAYTEEKAGQLTLIQTSPRGGVPDTIGKSKRTVRVFNIPHLERIGHLNADEIQNIRAFGSETEVETVQAKVDGILNELRPMHEVTWEFHRISAIKGLLLDADGTTIYNMFTEFGVAQQTAAIAFTVATTDVKGGIVDALRHIESELGGTVALSYRAFCGGTFFDALTAHATVREAFKYQQGQLIAQDLRTVGFTYGGVTWEEYRGNVSGQAFVPVNEAFIVPFCSPSIFVTSFAPADYIETVNTVALPLYAKQYIDEKYQKFVEIETQSNPLCLNLRPRAVFRVTMS